METNTRGCKVFLASHPIDFRKGPDSLLSLVRDAGSDPFNGSLYVFRAKRADRHGLETGPLCGGEAAGDCWVNACGEVNQPPERAGKPEQNMLW